MKKTFPMLLFLLSVTFMSCEKEVEQDSLNTISDSSDLIKSAGFTPDPCCHEENLFERRLHWLSFISAEVVINNTLAKNELKTFLTNNGGDPISAEDLLEHPTMSNFYHEFYSRLVGYFQFPGTPGNSGHTPPWPPGAGGSPNPPTFLADEYLAIMIDDNCVEMYFPKGLNFKGSHPPITSTAHPLTSSGANEGIKFQYSDWSQEYYSSSVIVNDTYVVENRNILVARPIRNEFQVPNDPCNYTEYNGIDFEDFLD